MEALEPVERALQRRPDVRLAYLFGSAARGEERAASDIDVAILLAPAAVADAVADALAPLGVEITELPITGDRLFRSLHAANARSGDQR